MRHTDIWEYFHAMFYSVRRKHITAENVGTKNKCCSEDCLLNFWTLSIAWRSKNTEKEK
jgi:hypothetical protein